MFTHRVRFVPLAVVAAATAVSLGPATGQEPTTYVLTEGSTFQRGCFPPCECPIMQEVPLAGTFNLEHASSDPDWFETYEVTDVHWVADPGGQNVLINGAGIYRIGGNFALQHRLALDLAVGQDPVEHYDSGTIPGGSEFPAIAIEISIHGGWCYDTVMVIRAKPTMTIEVDDAAIAWDDLPAAAGYDLVRGDLGLLRATGGDFAAATTGCMANDTGVPALTFGDAPAPGSGFWFGVRAWGEGIVSTYDSNYPAQLRSRDPGIAAAPLSCP
jgi:hypothetical protein